MNSQANPKVTFGCLTAIVIVILLVSYLATASLNPLAVYASDSILAKIIVTVLAGLLAISLLQLLGLSLVSKSIEKKAHKRSDDVICPGCGLPLIQYSSSHGPPIACPKCENYWHNGPACYNKGMAHAMIVIATYLCPHCRSDASHDRDLFDDEGFTRST